MQQDHKKYEEWLLPPTKPCPPPEPGELVGIAGAMPAWAAQALHPIKTLNRLQVRDTNGRRRRRRRRRRRCHAVAAAATVEVLDFKFQSAQSEAMPTTPWMVAIAPVVDGHGPAVAGLAQARLPCSVGLTQWD